MSLVVDIKKNFKTFTLDVSFEAGNETLGFLGASGCGKSLTLRSIAGIETPDEGKIIVDGEVYFDRAPGKRPNINLTPQQRKTAMLFQNYQLFPNLTVAQNITAGLSRDVPKEEAERVIEAQLARFGLQGKAKRYPAQLSGGQQQRVALARMLAARPNILMLDEPFSALDAHMKSALEQNLLGLFEEFDGTILYISHDIDEAFRFCDRIAVVEDGHIEEISSKQDLVNSPKSLASIKLSGCKNTTPVKRIDDHHVALLDYGITVACDQTVPQDAAYYGVRAFHIQQTSQPGPNVFRARCDRVSDARFDRTVMLSFLDADPELQALAGKKKDPILPAKEKKGLFKRKGKKVDEAREHGPESDDHSMRFLRTHLQWRIDKLACNELPEEGDEVLVRIPSDRVYLVNH